MKTIRMIGAFVAAAGMAAGAWAQSGDKISDSAAVYATYQSEVTDVKTKPLSSANDIDHALTSLGGHNPDRLSSGWISYSALIASQDPEYRAAVHDIESFYGRDALLKGLSMDARYARKLNGGDNAVSAALTATDADSRRLNSAAAYVKEQAYSLQAAGWAKAKIGNARAKASKLDDTQNAGIPAAAPLLTAFSAPDIDSVLAQAGVSGAPSLWDNVSTAASAVRFPAAVTSGLNLNRKRVKFGKEPIADQIATLAAYRVLGADSATPGQLSAAMNERETENCMSMANLNLQQCVAAANQQYEVPFCIGEHALSDVGKCIGGVYQ
ncbi:MAG TPA: hypothetical protein PLR76_11120 [Hyphomonas sp.]|nr:hypothetical protein [Hyphomonas sp.]MCA8905129.1 hypothetical protein [Hyphomonas sp.]MCB9969933.1 hypothetical protein [Hyphomonas sp.]HPE48943.1 hypothetical protein [Hyphomonas sp.]